MRSFKKTLLKNPDIRQDIEDALKLLVQDPFVPVLETHKLSREDDIFLIEIGTHDEVY